MDPITKDFVADIHRFVKHEGVDLVAFEKGQRKDDVAHEYLANFDGDEGVLFVGKAQEKTSGHGHREPVLLLLRRRALGWGGSPPTGKRGK
jgi:hypothetical protein